MGFFAVLFWLWGNGYASENAGLRLLTACHRAALGQNIRLMTAKSSVLAFSILAWATASLFSAEPKEQVKAAAKSLAQKANYSWVTTSKNEGDGNLPAPGPMEGQAEKGGYTYVSFSVGNNDVEMAFKGDKAAIKREDQWEATDELEGNNAWIAARLKAFKAPAAEAEEIASKIEDLKKNEDNSYSGTIGEVAAKELINRARRRGGNGPEGAKGSARFWVKDGVLSKYEYNVQGKLTVGQDNREVEINRTTSVEIKEVGSTTLKVPSAAKKKLEK